MTMKKTYAQRSADILKNSQGPLATLYRRAKKISEIDSALQKHLPKNIAKHCHAANLHRNRLFISVSHANAAMQLRYLKSDLLSSLRQEPQFCQLTGIDFRIETPIKIKRINKKQKLSLPTARLSRQVCNHAQSLISVETSKPFKKALTRLLHHHHK